MNNLLMILVLITFFQVPSTVLGQVSGQVVDVRSPAQLVSRGVAKNIARNSKVSSGDLIRTGASGQVQLLFLDETKIVVGPNSTLRIDETLFRPNGKARKFATSALGGTFRFMSGNSPMRVYQIATPTATMGIRGTEFDFTVTTVRATDLLVFIGSVQLCNANRRCVAVPSGCQLVAVQGDGSFSQPQTVAQKRQMLEARFPLLRAQSNLQPQFRTSTEGCDRVTLFNLPGAPIGGGEDRGNQRGGGSPAEGPSDPGGGGGGNPAE